MSNPKKIVLAYSGGLDTSVILPWLKERYPGVTLVAFAAELGQGSELKGIERKARKSGADEVVVADLRKEFAEQYCFPMLRAHATYEGDYLLGTSIARPLIAKAQVDVAHKTGADAVAHGATGKGNDQVRFELTAMALDPTLAIISPWKDPRFLADGSVEISITGKEDQNYRLQAATTLVAPDWIDLKDFTQTNETGNVVVSEAANFSSRFYRVVHAP